MAENDILKSAIVSYSIAVVVMFIMTISGNTTIPTPNLTLAQQASISNNALGGIGTTGQNYQISNGILS